LRASFPPALTFCFSDDDMLLKNDEPRERLIVALDVPTRAGALALVGELDGLASFYKVGYQLFVAEGMSFVRELLDRGLRVFLDLKMDDVDETITSAVREVARNHVHLLTLHGGAATVRAAVAGRGDGPLPKLLSVTLLSSLGEQDLVDFQIVGPNARFKSLLEYVLWRAEQAVAAGCDGLIASGQTIGAVRQHVGSGQVIISPGIRPSGTSTNERKRSATPGDAITAGADYLVVGRPVRNAPDPRSVVCSIIEEIERATTMIKGMLPV
jgi:orotidine-5'-phosphate decarboxylase